MVQSESYDNVAANTSTPVNSSSFSNPSVQPNLVLYYPFDDSTSDYSGYGNDLGLITSSSHTFSDNGVDNKSLTLDGVSDGLQTTNTFNNPESFTVSLWINSDDNSGRLIENEWGNGPWVIYKYDNQSRYQLYLKIEKIMRWFHNTPYFRTVESCNIHLFK